MLSCTEQGWNMDASCKARLKIGGRCITVKHSRSTMAKHYKKTDCMSSVEEAKWNRGSATGLGCLSKCESHWSRRLYQDKRKRRNSNEKQLCFSKIAQLKNTTFTII